MAISAVVAITSIFVLAGFVKGVVGLGLPTVAMGLLAVVMTPAQAAALLVVPSFLTNAWQAMGPELLPLTRRLWSMLLGICAEPGPAPGSSSLQTAHRRRRRWAPCSRSTACSA
jgi:uncharacterized protein